MARQKKDYNLNKEMIGLLDEFVEHLKLFEKSDKTIVTYLNCMKQFIDDNNVKSTDEFVEDMDKKWWLTYVKEQKEKKEISIATLNKKMRIYSSFYSFLKQNDYLEGDIACKVDKIKNNPAYKGDEILSIEQIKQLLDVTDNSEFKGQDEYINLRNKTIIYLMCDIAPRIEEVSKIRIEDIKLEDNGIYIRGKGHKGEISRYCNIKPIVKELIIELIEAKPNRRFLFENIYNEQLNTQTIRKVWNRGCAIIGVENITPHKIRHSIGTLLADKGVSPTKIGHVLGHSKGSRTAEKFYIKPQENVQDELEILDIF